MAIQWHNKVTGANTRARFAGRGDRCGALGCGNLGSVQPE
jgi:hypothetical protein